MGKKNINNINREDLYCAFFNQLKDGICRVRVTDPIPVSLPASEQLDLIMKLSVVEFCNNSFLAIIGAASTAELSETSAVQHLIYNKNPDLLRDFISSGYSAAECEVNIKNFSGVNKFFQYNYYGILENEYLTDLFILIRDITEQKKNEDTLYFQTSLLDQVNTAVIVTNSDGYITYWNAFAESLYTWKKEEALGKHIVELTVPDINREEGLNAFARIKLNGTTEGEIMLKRKDGSEFHGYVLNSIIRDKNGNFEGIVGLSNDVSGRKKNEEYLQKSREQLRNLAKRLEYIREEERKYVAREIHDELGQELTALKMEISILSKKLADRPTIINPVDIKDDIDTVNKLIDGSIQTVRKISSELRYNMLDELGLFEAIEWHLNILGEKTGIKYNFNTEVDDSILDKKVSSSLFRIFQEAITNILRHANASAIDVSISLVNNQIILEISDNGIGINSNDVTNKKSLGILGMKERALIHGGSVEITGKVDAGTKVTIKIPVIHKI